MIKVTVWNEYAHEKIDEKVREVHPNGIHGTLKSFLDTDEELVVRTATLDDPDCGLTQEVLDDTDVLIWWGHMKHGDVPDDVVDRVQAAVLDGMGAIFLHSGHHSKPFRRLMGTTCNLEWRETNDRERVWITDPAHPIARGVNARYFELEAEETYGERFDIPEPDRLIMIGWYNGGEVFRSGCCFNRGNGRIFYFQPGHETFRTFYHPTVQLIIKNAVHWAAQERPTVKGNTDGCLHSERLEPMGN